MTEITTNQGEILWNAHPIQFFSKTPSNIDEYLNSNNIEIARSDCGWSFIIQNPATITGLMIPIGSFEVIICDTPIEMYKSKQHYYAPARELERILQFNIRDLNIIESPIVHFISDRISSSWSCPNECIISTFVHNYQWHINFVTIAQDSLTFFLDESSNFLVNMQRFPLERKEVLINETSSIHAMQRALLSGSTPRQRPNYSHDIIQKTRHIQLELTQHNIKSAIIGSLARRLNSIPVDVNDIDLMVSNKEELDKAINAVGSFTDVLKIQGNSAKFQHCDYTIELCCDNYNILPGKNNIVHRHGLTYVNIEGLLWLYMINLFACNIDEHSDDYKNHILNALCSLCEGRKLEESVIPYQGNMDDYSKRCFELCQQLSSAEMKYYDIRINKPLTIRCFQDSEKTMYPIVNLGSPCGAQVVINFVPKKAHWNDIKGRDMSVSIEPQNEFSIIRIPDVDVPGILECE